MKNIMKLDFTPFYISIGTFIALYLLMPKWIYSPIALTDTDPWLQIGYFLDYKLMAHVYYSEHFKDIISTNFLGIFFYKIFSPFWANLLLKFFRFSIFGYFIYSIAKFEINKKTAILTLFVSLTSYTVLIAFGGDYTDGWIVFYLTATIYSLLKAYRDSNVKILWLIFSGIFYCLMIGAGFQSLIYTISLFAMLILLENKKNNKFKLLSMHYLYPFIGCLICFCILNLVNYLYIGDFWYCKNSITRALSFVEKGRWQDSMNILSKNNILFAIFILFISTFIYCKNIFKLEYFNNFNFIILITTWINIIIMLFLEIFLKQELISNINYFNHIIPFIILLYAAYVIKYLSESNKNLNYIFMLAIVFYFCIIWYMPGPSFIPEYFPSKLTSIGRNTFMSYPIIYDVYVYIGIILILASYFLFSNFKKKFKFILFLILIILFNFTPFVYTLKNEMSIQFKHISGKDFFESVVDWFYYSNKINKKRKKVFWYNEIKDTYIKTCLGVSNSKKGVFDISMPYLNISTNTFKNKMEYLNQPGFTITILCSDKNDAILAKQILEKENNKEVSIINEREFLGKCFKIFIIEYKINNNN